MKKIKVIQPKNLGKGLGIDQDTQQVQIELGNGLRFSNTNQIELAPQPPTPNTAPNRTKYRIALVNEEQFTISNNWEYYAYILKYGNGIGIFHLRVHTKTDFVGQSLFARLPSKCEAKDLFEIKDQNGRVQIWTGGKNVTIYSRDRIPAGTQLDFHNIISLKN